MMILTLLVTLSLVTTIKADQLDCSYESYDMIEQCIRDTGITRRTWRTCKGVEAFFNCVESINGNCAKNGRDLYNLLDIDYSQNEIRSNERCYHQKFDQYFNQDGQCSFEDFRE